MGICGYDKEVPIEGATQRNNQRNFGSRAIEEIFGCKAARSTGDILMISDAPYQSGVMVLSPAKGALAGGVGAILTLLIVTLLRTMSGISAIDILASFSIGIENGTNDLIISATIYLFAGFLLGLLYALCEQHGPPLALMFVGIFYGLLLWVLSGIIFGTLLSESGRGILRSWPFLLACLVYGLWLALVAVFSMKHNPIATDLQRD